MELERNRPSFLSSWKREEDGEKKGKEKKGEKKKEEEKGAKERRNEGMREWEGRDQKNSQKGNVTNW